MKGIVHWFIGNPIAANLLMLVIIIAGFNAIPQMGKEYFPYRELNRLQVTVVYPGAGPSEVEKQICKKIEDAIHNLDGIKELESNAFSGYGEVFVHVEPGYDSQRLLDDVQTRVNTITTFPNEVEPPRVSETLWKSRALGLALVGDIEEGELKTLGYRIRDELAEVPFISEVNLNNLRSDELAVEVFDKKLREYNLVFDDVINAIRTHSLKLPAGEVKTAHGDIQLEASAQALNGTDFEKIPLRKNIDGSIVRVSDVAQVIDGFEEKDNFSQFNGRASLGLDVMVSTNPNILKTSEYVRKYIEELNPTLPDGVELIVWSDLSLSFQDRIETLLNNGIGGLILVFVILMLFLRPALALWVCVGIATAFLGALALMPLFGLTLNMMSLFAFILILGIVVDDAIIVGESIHSHQSRDGLSLRSAYRGAVAVLKPVTFAVLTTMIFFSTMFFLPGDAVRNAYVIAGIVILALSFSLIECLFILPSHLSTLKPVKPSTNFFLKNLAFARLRCSNGLQQLATNVFRPIISKSLDWWGLVLSIFLISFILVIAIYSGGWIKKAFFPVVPSNYIFTTAVLPEGDSFVRTTNVLTKLEAAAKALQKEYLDAGNPVMVNIQSFAYDNTARVIIALDRTASKKISAKRLTEQWREYIGELPYLESFDFRYTIVPIGKPIQFKLASSSVETLEIVSEELRSALAQYDGIINIKDSLQSASTELHFSMKPEAETLSLSFADVARQVRQGFYGEEVQRIPRLREDVKVMVRYSREERAKRSTLEEMHLRTGEHTVPLGSVAELAYFPSYRRIHRLDRRRTAVVTADIVPGTAQAGEVIRSISLEKLDDWRARFPELRIDLDGEQKEESDFVSGMLRMMGLALLISFGLMAIVFRSYWQPLLILTAVPFAFSGGLIGHMVMAREVSIMSLLGMIACAGVVINDNLVLIDRINQLRADGLELVNALIQAGQDRFRPILLTSVTTFVGLTPIMMETSSQAKFLIPMVVSLSFGVLLATPVTLILVPLLYMLGFKFRLAVIQMTWLQRFRSSEVRE